MFLAALKRNCEIRGLEKKAKVNSSSTITDSVDSVETLASAEKHKDGKDTEKESTPTTPEEKFMWSMRELIS